VRFLETYRDEPFFVVASFLKPHNPFTPPAEYAALYRPEEMPLPEAFGPDDRHLPPQLSAHRAPGAGTPEGEAWARRFLAAYYGNVTHMDACAGRILDALEGLGLAQDTLVLYTTDHGEMGYEHGLRGKFNFFEASARLPLLVRLPGVVPAGAATRALVDQADFVPTLLELCAVPPAPRSRPLDGTSFAPALADPAHPGKAFAFGEFALGGGRPFYMRRGQRWKYVLYTAGGEALCDPEVDPYERTNLALDPAYGPVLAGEREALLAFLREQGATVPPA
jgi:choline-sulfatase